MISRNFFVVPVFVFISLSVLLSLTYCSDVLDDNSNKALTPISSIPHYNLPTKPLSAVGDVTGYVNRVLKIHLSPEVARKIGVIHNFTVVDDTDLILVDEIVGRIIRLNEAGEIVWQVQAKDDDYRYFTEIVECTFDPFNRRIVVHNSSKSFFMDFNGNPIDVKRKPDFDYNQMFYASANDQLFSAQVYRNSHMLSSPKQLFWYRDSTFQKVMINSVPYAPEHAVYSGMPEVTRLNGKTYYHATLRDTFYEVNLPNVLPAFTLDAPTRPTIDEIMRNDNVDNKFGFMLDNGIPIPFSVVADDNNIFLSTKTNRGNCFSIFDRKTEKWIVGSNVIKYQNTYMSAPVLYHENYFLREIADYRVEHYAKLAEGMDPSDPEWKEELARLDAAYDETGGKTIYLIKL